MASSATIAGWCVKSPAVLNLSFDYNCLTSTLSSSWRERNYPTLSANSGRVTGPISLTSCPKAFVEKYSDTPSSDGLLSGNQKKSSESSPENLQQNRRNHETGGLRSLPRKTWKSRTGRNVKKTYGDRLTAILEALDSEANVERGLESLKVKLNAKEQSVILNEQKDWSRALVVFCWLKKQEGYNPVVIHYNIMLKILGRAQQWGAVEEIWAEMQQENIPATNVTFSTLIDVYDRAGRTKQALEWFEFMKSRGLQADTVTTNTVINLHKKQGNVAAVEEIFKGLSLSHTELEDTGVKTDSRQKIRLLPSRDVETYNAMIDLYGKAGRFADASCVFSDMMDAGVAPDTVTFNTMIRVCGLAGRKVEAEAMYLKMEERGIVPDLATFNILIAVFSKEGNLQMAMDYLQRMKEKAIVPDEVTYHTLLRALTSRDKVKDVESVLDEMQELSLAPGEGISVGLVLMYLRSGNLGKASKIVASLMEDGLLGSASYAAIINAYGEQNLWYEAEKLFLVSREKWTVRICNTMMKAYGLAGLHDKAVHVLTSVDENGLVPDETTFNTLLHSLVASDSPNMEKIQQTLGKMWGMNYKLQRSTSNMLIGFYAKVGLVREAEETFKQMMAEGVGLDGGSYAALLNAYAEAGLIGKAEQVIVDMKEAGFPANEVVLTTLMKLYGKAGKLEEAGKILTDIEELRGGPDLFATNLLIDLYARDGNIKDAETIFKRLEEKGRINEVTLTTMLETYKRTRQVKRALGMARRMLKKSDLKDVASYNSILGLYASLGRVTEAMEVLKVLESRNVSPDIRTYTVMAGVLKRIDSVQEAIDLLSRASSSGQPQSLQSLTTLVSLYARAGLFEETFEVCSKLRNAGFSLDVAAYNSLIFAYGSAGRFDESLRTFMEMQSKELEPDAVTYTTVITVYGKAGLLEGVSRMFKRMKQAGCVPSVATFNAVIDIYKKAGKMELAAMVYQEMKFTEFLRQQGSRQYTELSHEFEV